MWSQPTPLPVAFAPGRTSGAENRITGASDQWLVAGRTDRRPQPSRYQPLAGDHWLVYAAPFAVAMLWLMATGASLLLWSATGLQAPLDWCRSGGVLLGTGVLALLAALVASALKGVRVGPDRFENPTPRRRPMVELPVDWLVEEGGFSP